MLKRFLSPEEIKGASEIKYITSDAIGDWEALGWEVIQKSSDGIVVICRMISDAAPQEYPGEGSAGSV